MLFPDEGITKADLADYYRGVAGPALRHLRGRPLMLERYPDGITGPRIMQKEVPDYFPDWVHRIELPKAHGTVHYALCDNRATLQYLAGQACVTLHRWLAGADRPHHPDRLVFDLDPADDDFEAVRTAAGQLRSLLEGDLRLPTAVMTTGSRGLHVLIPLDRSSAFDEVRAFARDCASLLAQRHPDQLTTETRKTARRGRLYLDIGRNAYAQTAVAPYAVRALPGAPVATPITWQELADPDTHARAWTLATIGERLHAADPWADALRRGRSLRPARRRLDALLPAPGSQAQDT
jgi:bifunctional non-homologous end joining protein LigD